MADWKQLAEIDQIQGPLYWLWDGDAVVIGLRRCATITAWGPGGLSRIWGFDVRCFDQLEFRPDDHFKMAAAVTVPAVPSKSSIRALKGD